LYAIENLSLANYLRYARPWVATADQCLAEAIRHIGDQQREFAERVGSLIIERYGRVEGRSFPFRFTAYNDLSVAYLAPRVMEDQERIVRQVRAIAHQLCADAVACDLASEILGAEQAHLDNLRELLDKPRSDTSHQPAVAALSEQRCQDDAPHIATAA
ncbi:MAG: hypothetical protein KDA60_20030, partial [Planctomycetales bacterium]|nr:hypothetical protein [Planctomycetales bacterium]